MTRLIVTLYDREGSYPDAQPTRENPLVRRQLLTDVTRFRTAAIDEDGQALGGLFLVVEQQGGVGDLFGNGGAVTTTRFNYRDIIGLQGE